MLAFSLLLMKNFEAKTLSLVAYPLFQRALVTSLFLVLEFSSVSLLLVSFGPTTSLVVKQKLPVSISSTFNLTLSSFIFYRIILTHRPSVLHSTAGRMIKTGLTAAVIISDWTWAATLLQSANVAWLYGVSGPFW
jgi:hypothetical protein